MMHLNRSADYYQLLGITPQASEFEIRKAYFNAIRVWHPDVNPDDEQKAAEATRMIITAYETLRDPELRSRYDTQLVANLARSDRREMTVYEPMLLVKPTPAPKPKPQIQKPPANIRRLDRQERWRTFLWGAWEYHEEEQSFGSTLAVGLSGWLTALAILCSLMNFGLLAWVAVIAGIKTTFIPNDRFVGIGTIVKGMMIWVPVALAITGIVTFLQKVS